MLFGCPLPDELDDASIGQRAVVKAFEMILSEAATEYPWSLYRAMCHKHEQQGDDTKLVMDLFMYLHAMFAHVTIHSQHSNWSHYGTHLSKMVVQELLNTSPRYRVIVF